MSDAPYQFFDTHVLRKEQLTPSMIRVAFGGPDLARMASAGRDQRIKLFLPHPGQDAPVVPSEQGDNWYAAWRELDPSVRGIMRTYTTRALTPDELLVDFALHGTTAPASGWAQRCAPGDRVSVLAPVDEENGAYDFRPPQDSDWLLLTGDESALPAVASILETLPAGQPVRVWLEVRDPADRQELKTAADATVEWVTAGGTVDAVRAADLPDGSPYAWIAGESATVKALRRHLVGERGFDKRRVKFTGYWRQGATEDDLLTAGEDA
ncbi:siderophore-interacting protein [Streptomyces indicus]|uniref:NADPH-dependent ferric siderophore reductase, contains FAD-binding and SIP domains n=1 Tax=Streptomyces indicus TaxID=417292 RepID=A0A1G8Y042_9ACTN|nr:siderophore-interacting protein [Streptomyces indicus]SDJ96142.1 NADPH-dependent ferric siderophore reductase, contains FAD-binding and SIP domains [Streptomyces indicus]